MSAETSAAVEAAPLRVGETPLTGVDAVLVDLDGVVYKGDLAITGAVESLSDAGVRVGYITNNASRTAETVAAHLERLGLPARPEDVVTSSQAAARMLLDLVPAGSEILVVGGEGLLVEVERAGLVPVQVASDATSAVVQGFSPDLGWTQLAEAAFALQGQHAERHWVATNSDWTIPVARGVAPGNGTLVSAVHTAVGRMPVVAGKPETPIFETAMERFGATSALVVGDRLDTDILGANRADIRSALVLTGIDGAKQLLAADKTMRPGLILGDLTELALPYPEVVTSADGTTRVRDSAVRLVGRRLELVEAGDFVDLVRAACAAVWSSGVAIYAIDVTDPLLDALRIAR